MTKESFLNGVKKALIIGAGSGRDVFSSIIITEYLLNKGINVDLAGFLTPWAIHLFQGKIENSVNRISGSNSEKYLPYNKRILYNANFTEKYLYEFNLKYNLRIGRIYLLSLQYGTSLLTKDVQHIVTNNNYDLIIVVDVGGDILANKNNYNYLSTPIVDKTCASIVKNLKTNARKILAVISPGSDGELPADVLEKYIHSKYLLSKENLKQYPVEKFLNINAKLNLQTNSYSKTFEIVKNVLFNQSINNSKKKFINILDYNFSYSFIMDVNKDLLNKIIFWDFSVLNDPLSNIKFENLIECTDSFLEMNVSDLEISTSCISINPRSNDSAFSLQCLIFNSYIPIGIKKEIINYVSNLLSVDIINGFIIKHCDKFLITNFKGLEYIEMRNILIFFNSKCKNFKF